MNPHKKFLLVLSILLLTALACTTVTSMFENQPQQPNFGPAVQNDDPAAPEVEIPQPDLVEPAQDEGENNNTSDETPEEQPHLQNPNSGSITATGDAAAVEVTAINWHEDEDGYITFLGVLQNNGSTDLTFVELAFILRDENGSPVTSDYTYASLDIIPAGESSPFQMLFYDPPYAPWVSYEILIEGDVNEYFDQYSDFEVLSTELQEDSFGYTIAGELKNTGTLRADFVYIAAVLYNKEEEIIAVDFTFADEDVINPGDSSTFSISIWDTLEDQEPDHFELFIQGNPSE